MGKGDDPVLVSEIAVKRGKVTHQSSLMFLSYHPLWRSQETQRNAKWQIVSDEESQTQNVFQSL